MLRNIHCLQTLFPKRVVYHMLMGMREMNGSAINVIHTFVLEVVQSASGYFMPVSK